MQIFVRDLAGKSLCLDLPLGVSTPVHDVKAVVEGRTGMPMSDQRLLFACKQLDERNGRSVGDYGVGSNATLELCGRLRGGCGIVAYLGKRSASEVLIKGLARLEYRGYDSAGIGVLNDESNQLQICKKVGKVKALKAQVESRGGIAGSIGIGHTRWATHGEPSDRNSHPHSNNEGTLCVVHNGIIENFAALRKTLIQKGYTFKSDTDTEVLAHLVEECKSLGDDMTLEEAVALALCKVEGAFGVCFVDSREPDKIVAARHGSPLILGLGEEGEYFFASDAAALVEYTRSVAYLEEGEMCVVQRGKEHIICSLDSSRSSFTSEEMDKLFQSASNPERSSLIGKHKKVRSLHTLELTLAQIEKGGHKHFMLKEVLEQPDVLRDCMRGRINAEDNSVQLGGLLRVMDKLMAARRFIICACGTSWHSGLVGEYLIEDLARVPVEVEYASEFRYRRPILYPNDVVIVISQSGETADTLAAVREAKKQGVLTIGFVNSVGSTIARETDAGCYLHVGHEIGVASTKAFSGQIMCLTMFALMLAKSKHTISPERCHDLLEECTRLPELMSQVMTQKDRIENLCKIYKYASNFLYLGRGYNFPVALEGALKLKEISYIHAEGYPAAEMKHGPLALIDKFMPVIIIALKSDPTYSKTKANIEEVVARQGSVIIITEEGNHELDEQAEFVIYVPLVSECLSPLLTVVPLQLLSYYVADMRGCSIDQPRNLAKSVTVE